MVNLVLQLVILLKINQSGYEKGGIKSQSASALNASNIKMRLNNVLLNT